MQVYIHLYIHICGTTVPAHCVSIRATHTFISTCIRTQVDAERNRLTKLKRSHEIGWQQRYRDYIRLFVDSSHCRIRETYSAVDPEVHTRSNSTLQPHLYQCQAQSWQRNDNHIHMQLISRKTTFVCSWRRPLWLKRPAITCWLILLSICAQSIRPHWRA